MDPTDDQQTDPLAAAGLAPASEGTGDPAPAVPAPTGTPAAAPAAASAAPGPEDDDEIVLPEGADNPDAVRNLIQAERKAAREANARRRAAEEKLREQEEADKPLEQQIADARAGEIAATLKAVRYEVAAEAGLDLSLASRLQGDTREELVADAETFKGVIGSTAATPTTPAPEGGFRTPPPAKQDPVKAHNDFIGALLGGAQQSRGSRDPLASLEPAPED